MNNVVAANSLTPAGSGSGLLEEAVNVTGLFLFGDGCCVRTGLAMLGIKLSALQTFRWPQIDMEKEMILGHTAHVALGFTAQR